MNHSDVIYIIYCRIDGIKELSTEEIAALVDTLARAVSSASAGKYEAHTSVYGCLILVPLRVTEAFELAKSILRQAADGGVELAIGIACGNIADTEDILGSNIAGVWVNCAARLAH